MFHDKKSVDRHVQEVFRKLKEENERNLRSYNIAKLYYQVGDYESARRYVSSYLEVREDSAGAHKLLGQTLEALDQKEAALAEYKCSLEIEGRQDDLVLKVCELLADINVGMDVSRARYWLERADRQFGHHPIIFQLKEKLLTADRPNDNAEDLEALIASELAVRPMDVTLRVKLLHHYMDKNRLEDAYKHAVDVEATYAFRDNIVWYQAICEMLTKCKDSKRSDWAFWVLYVSAFERLAALSLKEQGDGPKKTVPEAAQAVLNFDQSLTEAELHKQHSNDPTFAEHLFAHMWGQLHLHLACLLLRKTKREQGSWSEAGRLCSPLLLCALHTNPPDPTALWAARLKDQRRAQVNLWYREASYRCSQAGHVLQDYAREDTKRFLDKIDKFCTGAWRGRVYQRIFVSRVQQNLMKTSYFAHHPASNPPLRLCTHNELKHHDEVSEEVWPASLHYQVWLGIKSRPHHSQQNIFNGPHPHQYSHVFPELQFSVYNLNHAAADSLSRLDIDAFLNAAVLCASVVMEEQQRSGFLSPDRLPTLPADMTNTLCSSAQEKWWTAAYKMYREQEGVGSEIGEIRQILQRGLEVVRCIDNHGLHPCLLVHLARIFQHRAKVAKEKNEEHSNIPALEARSELYWSAAVPLLERLQNNQAIRSSGTKLFDYQGKEMNNVELTNALDEGRLLLAQRYLRDKQYEQAIAALQALKCAEASFQQGQIYQTLANELVSSLPRESLTSELRSQHIIMLSKARDAFYLTLDRLRSPGTNPKHPLNSELCTHIAGIENELKRIDPDLWRNDLNRNECEELSDESYSSAHSAEHPVINTSFGNTVHKLNTPQRGTHRTPNQSSTPCRPQHQDIVDLSRNRTEARPSPERLDAQIRQLIHSRDNVIQTIMDQNKALLETNKVVVEQLEELKKEVADLRKETQKQRSQVPVNPSLEEDLYVLGEEDYGELNYGAPAATQPPGPASSFPGNMFASAQRHPAYSTLVYPPAALQGYYTGAIPFTDPAAHIPSLYPPSVYPMPALYPRPPVEPKVGSIPKMSDNVLQPGLFSGRLPNQMPDHIGNPDQPLPLQTQRMDYTKNDINVKDAPSSKAPPVNVVITTSDTLPTTVPTVQPTLSVTIPAHHRHGSGSQAANVPHNYQISMPLQATIPTTVNLPPLSTTLTTSIPTNLSVTEKNSGNSSILSTSVANDSNEWYVETEHDPIPDFVPVVPLPAEIEITTGEEGETMLYCAKAKLFRFVDKEWKERGVGYVKLLRNTEGKVRLLMRRDQVLKICANHLLRPDMELTKMPNNNKALMWVANDFADEEVKLEKLCIKFKTEDEAANFKLSFDKAKASLPTSVENVVEAGSKTDNKSNNSEVSPIVNATQEVANIPVVVGGFSFTTKPIIQEKLPTESVKSSQKSNEPPKQSPFAEFSFTKPVSTSTSIGMTTTAGIVSDGTNFAPKLLDSKSTGFAFGTSSGLSTTQTTSVSDKVSFAPKPIDVKSTGFTFGKPSLPVASATTASDGISVVNQAVVPAVQTLKKFEEPVSPKNGSTSISLFPPRTPLRRPHAPAPNVLAAANIAVETPEKSNNSSVQNTTKEDDKVEEFVPTAEFSPVIALPEIIEVITGEEGETVLFEERGKLLRYDTDSKQWKERGIGQMKILLEPTSGKIRLLMRREQVLKVCCNHTLLAQLKFSFMTGNSKAISWCAQDYSEGEVKPEMFAIRFKTADQASQFHDVITTQQKKMVNDRIPATEIKTNANNILAQQRVDLNRQEKSLAEMFKPAIGSWECGACYTRNDESRSSCLACESASPSIAKPSVIQTEKNDVSKQKKSLAEMFKPAVGSWECGACYTRNDAANNKCLACESPSPNVAKPPTLQAPVTLKPSMQGSFESTTWNCNNCQTKNYAYNQKCKACGNSSPAITTQTEVLPDKMPLSQLFKPASGSWKCEGCYVVNSSSNNYCVACDAPKDPSMPAKPKTVGFNVMSSSVSSPSFSFGITPTISKESTGGFTFGMPKSDVKAAGDSTTPAQFNFGSQPLNSSIPFSFDVSQNLGVVQNSVKPFTFGSPGKSFDFHFQAKSPVKSPGGGETSEDEVAESEDVYFAPVIPLPDKVDVKTGEENEEVLYSHRAKLFRYEAAGKEWKERGLGDIKLLKHKDTGKLRLLMRRDQVLKLCLNHVITSDMEFTAKDDKTWLWYAADYSDGDISHENFACRFKTPEIAQEFKTAIENSKASITTPSEKPISKAPSKSPVTIKKNLFNRSISSSDVEIVYEASVTPEEKSAALKLQLPEKFYAYKRMPDCPGCRGCKDSDTRLAGKDSEAFESNTEKVKPLSNTSASGTKPIIFGIPKLTNVPTAETTSALSPASSGDGKVSSLGSTGSSTPTSTSSSSTVSLSFGEKPVSNVFGNVSSTTSLSNTGTPTSGSGCSTQTSIPFGTPPTTNSTNIFGGTCSTTISTVSSLTFGGNTPKTGGFLFGEASSQINPATTSSVPTSGSNTSSGIIFSFGGTNDKVTDSGADIKALENQASKICTPTRLTAVTTASIFSGTKSSAPIFGMPTVFGSTQNSTTTTFTNIFGGAPKSNATTAANMTAAADSGNTPTSEEPYARLLSPPNWGSLGTTITGSTANASSPQFGSVASKQSTFLNNGATTDASSTGVVGKSLFGTNSSVTQGFGLFGSNKSITPVSGETASRESPLGEIGSNLVSSEQKKEDGFHFLPTENVATFSTLAANPPQQPAFQKDPNFSFAGAGTSVFGSKPSRNTTIPKSSTQQNVVPVKSKEPNEQEEEHDNGEEHDPHFEPIIPLPDAIEVRTGEEDEEKEFCQRAKLYRFVTATREWKERGVGEMKLLHHHGHGTYRLLLRREQVHKVVCNFLLTADQEFRTLNSSDRAWCWAGMNYAEENPVLEELAVRFKYPELAKQFKDAIDKAQQTLRERLNTSQASKYEETQDSPEDDEHDEDENEDEEGDDLYAEDDEGEHSIMFEKRATLVAQEEGDTAWKNVGMGDLKVLYDHNIFGSRIVLILQADSTREIVSNTVISMQTEMQENGKECTWSAIDFAFHPPRRCNLKAIFSSVHVAHEFFMAFEEGQGIANESEILEPVYYIPEDE